MLGENIAVAIALIPPDHDCIAGKSHGQIWKSLCVYCGIVVYFDIGTPGNACRIEALKEHIRIEISVVPPANDEVAFSVQVNDRFVLACNSSIIIDQKILSQDL